MVMSIIPEARMLKQVHWLQASSGTVSYASSKTKYPTKDFISRCHIQRQGGRLFLSSLHKTKSEYRKQTKITAAFKPGVVTHTSNGSTQEAEAGGALWSRPGWSALWAPARATLWDPVSTLLPPCSAFCHTLGTLNLGLVKKGFLDIICKQQQYSCLLGHSYCLVHTAVMD